MCFAEGIQCVLFIAKYHYHIIAGPIFSCLKLIGFNLKPSSLVRIHSVQLTRVRGTGNGLGMTGSPAPSSVSGLMATGRGNYAPTRRAGAVENVHPGAHLSLAQSHTPSSLVPIGCLRPVTTSLLSPLPTCSVHPTSSSDPAVSPGPPPLEPQLLDSGTAAS